jgi:RNA polymerase sigma factor (sigma-70 family)
MAATRTLSESLQLIGRTLLDSTGISDAELVGRFVERREEAAFAALVRRHGTLVFGVCRRVLRHQQDAEDAFQATFLVLARNAAHVQRKGAVGNWLYGVAHNVARKARSLRTRREVKEHEAAARQRKEATNEAFDDLHEVIDRELHGLPDRYRTPIVLCDLQGLTTLEAATELGCPPKTVGTRLSRGRALLARRLTRRGIALPAVGLGLLVSDAIAFASPELLHSTIQTAIGSTTVPPTIAALTAGATNIMLVKSIKLGAAITLGTVALVGLSVGPIQHVVQAHSTGSTRGTGGAASSAQESPPVITMDDIHRFFHDLIHINAATADDKTLSGEWTKKDSDVKIAFDKDGLKLSPHGKDEVMLILCEYKLEKDGLVKAKITGHEGSKKDVIADKLPVGTEFSFKWKPNKDTATLEDVKGEKFDAFKSHLEGEFTKK